MTNPDREERTQWYQELAAARRDWEKACEVIDTINLPSKSPDDWAKAVVARDSAFQKFMTICNEKP